MKTLFLHTKEKMKKFNPSFISILIFIIALVLWISKVTISNKDMFYATTAGALLAFLLALVAYRISLFFENKAKDNARKENTKYVYGLYKMELQQNITHIDHLIEKKWLPYYRLKTITRDRLWGELADYSKDLDLMKQLNSTYAEFELINNKIDIINEARLARLNAQQDVNVFRQLGKEIEEQLAGCIGLGKNAKRMAGECLKIVEAKISRI